MANEHSFASPGPAGLGALAVICFAFYALLTGKVSHNAAPLLACWLIGGAICQIVTGVIELKDHSIVGGNVFLFFGAFFMVVTALSLVTKYGLAQAGLPMDTRVEGWCWLGGLCFLVMMTPAYLKSPKLLFFAIVAIDVALLCLVGLDMKLNIPRALFASIAGWALLFAGFVGIYMAGAIVLNTHFGKVILPTTKPIIT